MPESVTLLAGYTQEEAFFAALEVQLQPFANGYDARNFESPKVTINEETHAVTLESTKHNSTDTRNFNKNIDQAEKGEWAWLHNHCPVWEVEDNAWFISQKKLILYASTIIEWFEEYMHKFLCRNEIKEKLNELNIPYKNFLSAAARVFILIFSPFKSFQGNLNQEK
ncbi:MAG: hypothetical protein V4496_06270, partial [Pseudomonadota bacterium]